MAAPGALKRGRYELKRSLAAHLELSAATVRDREAQLSIPAVDSVSRTLQCVLATVRTAMLSIRQDHRDQLEVKSGRRRETTNSLPPTLGATDFDNLLAPTPLAAKFVHVLASLLLVPKRSNEFQRLILMLHQQLAPTGATVTESNLVNDPATGVVREADVTIDYDLAGYQIRIVVECRDRARRATIEWIDQLAGKYGSNVSKVVAVSRSGFTPQALSHAAAKGIDCLSAAEAVATDWEKWVDDLQAITVSFDRTELVDIPSVNLVGKSIRPDSMPAIPVREVVFREPAGLRPRTAFEIYDEVIERDDVKQSIAAKQPGADGIIKWGMGFAPGTTVRLPGGRELAAEGIIYGIRLRHETVVVPLKALRIGNFDVAFGTGAGTDWKGTILLTRGADGQPRTTLRLDSADGKFFPPEQYTIYGRDPLPRISPGPTQRSKLRRTRKSKST